MNIYGIDLNTKELFRICDDSAGCVTLYRDWVYYVNYDDMDRLYRIGIDGTGRQYLGGKAKDVHGGYAVFDIIDDWIYYSNGNDKGKIYRQRADGICNPIKVGDEECAYSISLAGNWIKYTTYNESGSKLVSSGMMPDPQK